MSFASRSMEPGGVLDPDVGAVSDGLGLAADNLDRSIQPLSELLNMAVFSSASFQSIHFFMN